MKNTRRNLSLSIAASLFFIAVAFFIQLSCGMYEMSWAKIFDGVFCKELASTTYFQHQLLGKTLAGALSIEAPDLASVPTEALIIWNVRIPRFLLGILIGVNLALAGCIFQAVTRNAMSSAYTLGISQGSGLSMLLILIIWPSLHSWLPLLSMSGGIAAFAIVYAIAWSKGASPTRLVLSGMILGSILVAVQKGLYYFIQDISIFQDVLSWTTGSLIGLSWTQLRMILPWTILVSVFCLVLYKPLNLMMLGDAQAKSLGVAVEKWRLAFSLVGILAASAAVSVAGLIGFVGLIVPHICRSIVGSDHKSLFIASMFYGASLLVFSDTVSRVILPSGQIPVGIVMNTIGGLFFMFLMLKHKGERC